MQPPVIRAAHSIPPATYLTEVCPFPALAAREAVADQPENQARRGDPLRAVALCWPLPLSRRRPDRNRQQRGGASRPAAGPQCKNALFAGSDGGAEHWAVIAS